MKRIIDGKEEIINAVASSATLGGFLGADQSSAGGKPIMVNSAFRSRLSTPPWALKQISGYHRRGRPADIRVPGMAPG